MTSEQMCMHFILIFLFHFLFPESALTFNEHKRVFTKKELLEKMKGSFNKV